MNHMPTFMSIWKPLKNIQFVYYPPQPMRLFDVKKSESTLIAKLSQNCYYNSLYLIDFSNSGKRPILSKIRNILKVDGGDFYHVGV